MTASASLGIGIVGCGMIANVHAHAIRSVRGAVLAGACSKTPARSAWAPIPATAPAQTPESAS